MNKTERAFLVLGDETRLSIIRLLSNEERMCAKEILSHLSITQPTLSHHMMLLVESGLVESRKIGRAVYYQLANQGIRQMIDELEGLLDSVPNKPHLSLSAPVTEEPITEFVKEVSSDLDSTNKSDKKKNKEKKKKKKKKD